MTKQKQKKLLSGNGWSELSLSSKTDRKVKKHDLTKKELLSLIPKPMITKFCDMIRGNCVSEAQSDYADKPRKGCIILEKPRGQTQLRFLQKGKEYCFWAEDTHLLLLETDILVDYPKVEVSHDCHRNVCVNTDHFLLESNKKNNERNACGDHFWCTSCYTPTRKQNCHEGKHGKDAAGGKLRQCRDSTSAFKPLPKTDKELNKRLTQLLKTNALLEQQITLVKNRLSSL